MLSSFLVGYGSSDFSNCAQEGSRVSSTSFASRLLARTSLRDLIVLYAFNMLFLHYLLLIYVLSLREMTVSCQFILCLKTDFKIDAKAELTQCCSHC